MFLKLLIYKLKRPFHFLKTALLTSIPAQIKTGFPQRKLKIITITGTDGKTTTSTLLYHILKTAGKKTALISTVSAKIGDEDITTGLHTTTPGPRTLFKLMKKMKQSRVEYLVLELTSHAVYQYRDFGIKPIISGLTNVTEEHLDYHVNYDELVKAKAMILKKAQVAIVNMDDLSYRKFKNLIPSNKLLTYSKSDKVYPQLKKEIQERFPEEYNQMNALLVIKIAKLLKIQNSDLMRAVKSFPQVIGRMQKVETNKSLDIFVDFAHTANAIRSGLEYLRKYTSAKQNSSAKNKNVKLIALFGSAARRDIFKRPLMGKYAAQLADIVVLTADDPRDEDVWSIVSQIKSDLGENHHKIISIADRREAIRFVLQKLAKPGDVIGLFGKGHEQSIAIGNVEYPWDEVKVVKEILSEKI